MVSEPSSTRSVEPAGLDDELADVDRAVAAGDAVEDDMEPVARRKHRVDERAWTRRSRRAEVLSIRSIRSRTSDGSRIVVVSSCLPSRATKTRCGSLIQISSTVGSSR